MRWILIFFFVGWHSTLHAQRVALVLSGGAAKGLAHIGVIKALEKHNIPIDYIVGTSMGGIIGGCYAAGMSPEEIEQMVLSESFLSWVSGAPEKGYNYHYYEQSLNPNFIKLHLSLDSTFSVQFNSSIANDVSLNFALAEKMAKASAVSNGNFDSLFVPLRVMAADVFTQSEVVLKEGILSDALRATQAVPFFYYPIRVDGKYLFDGGIYNNFPVDVAVREFSPDVIIGSNVSSKIFEEYPFDSDDKLINSSLLYMLLDKSDPSVITDTGVYIQPDLRGYTAFDFSSVRALIDSGYSQTMRQMGEILSKVKSRKAIDSIELQRKEFLERAKPLEFDELSFRVFNSKQRKYIRNVFKLKSGSSKTLTIDQIKRSYFQMVADPYFSNVYPNIFYKPETQKYNLQLTRRVQKNFQIDFGGVIATRNISSIFLGLNYYYFNRALTHAQLSFQTGSFYKSVTARSRIDLPFYNRMYLQPEFNFNQWNYLEGVDLVQETRETILKRFDRRLGMEIGWPMGDFFKGAISFTGFNNNDRYSNNRSFTTTDTLDELRLKGFKTKLLFSMSDLNRKQYASAGKAYSIAFDYFSLKEEYSPGSTSVLTDPVNNYHQWFRLKTTAEHFFTNRGWYRIGYYAAAVFSNQPVFTNYFGTVANAPAFLPIQDSRTLLLQNFRSFNYLAGGIRNVFVLRSKLDFRLEGYIFKPFDYLQPGNNQEATINNDLKSAFLAATAGFVIHAPIGPISLSLNYYDDDENDWGVLVHVGFLLFNRHSIEQ
jgi:NTE family protein